MMKKLSFLSFLVVVLPILFFIVENKKQTYPVVKKATSQVEKNKPLILPGKIKADRQVNLRFQTSGKLTWVGVEKGTRVKKGQPIAKLDTKELEKKFQKEMNDYLNERWDFEQTNDSYKYEKNHNLITDEIKRILEKAQFDLNNSVIQTEIADLAIKYATIHSPIKGIVTNVDQPIAGINITPATAEFTITDPNSVYFELEADEEEVVSLKNKMTGKIILDAYPNQEFNSEIKDIDFTPMSTSGSASYAVHCLLPENSNLRFRVGMSGEMEFLENALSNANL